MLYDNQLMKKKHQQTAEVVWHELAGILARELELPEKSSVSITKVVVAPDLRYATIWLDLMPEESVGLLYAIVRDSQKELRRLLAERLNWRVAPLLRFRVDKNAKLVNEIEGLLQQIREEK